MALPEGLRTPGRAAMLIPIVLALLAVLAALVVGWSHLTAKGPAPQLGETPQQAASGQGPAARDAYTPQDYVEPQGK